MTIDIDMSLYRLGIPEIDAEHFILFRISEEVRLSLKNNTTTPEFISAKIRQLIWYVNFHFYLEHIRMMETNYPEITAHVALHSRIGADMQALEMEHLEYNNPTVPLRLSNLLTAWLIDHIAGADYHLAQHILKYKNGV